MIALTHMRTRNDKKLASETSDIDLILGGHDHVYDVMKVCFQVVKFLFLDIKIRYKNAKGSWEETQNFQEYRSGKI